MNSTYSKLAIYAIRDKIDGKPVTQYDQVLSLDKAVIPYGPSDFGDFSAKLFVQTSGERRPSWAPFIEDGFGSIDEIVASDTYSALLVVRIDYYRNLFFAVAFGYSGRFLVRPDAYKRAYGLRTALNSLYPQGMPGTPSDYGPVKSVTAKTVSANTVHTLRQTDRSAPFEQFGLDIQRDLLGAVTGVPYDPEKWGPIISGSDALYLSKPTLFGQLGETCRQVERTSRREDYRAQFGWIDNIIAIEDPSLTAQLWERLIDGLKEDASDIELVVPAIVDYRAIETFRISTSEIETTTLSLSAYLDTLQAKGSLATLDLADLKGPNRLEIIDSEGNVLDHWPIAQCLSGQLHFRGKTYLLSSGEFYYVDPKYMGELDAYLSTLPESPRPFPEAPLSTHEDVYNRMLSDSSSDLLLLHGHNVSLGNRTTPVEICDLLSRGGELIHVKRKLGASGLSQLFSQGYVSAELLLTSNEFRRASIDKIREADEARSAAAGGAALAFHEVIQEPLQSRQHQVVYAIHADWQKRSLVQALPLFSKVNLRRHVDDLTRLGFTVAYKRIYPPRKPA